MAISTNSDNGRGRRRFHTMPALSDINVTPFVDVLLVLLVIFMLTAHVMEFGIEVEVPKVRQERNSAQELPVITITKSGSVYLNDTPDVNINALGAEVHKRFRQAKAVYVRADKDAVWDIIAQVVSAVNEAKLAVNMVTQPEDVASRKR